MDSRGNNQFEIECRLSTLGDMELQLLKDITVRLARGQDEHGYLSPHKKDWGRELYEELCDGLVYAGCELIRSRSGGNNIP